MMFNQFARIEGPDPSCPDGSPAAVCAIDGLGSTVVRLPSIVWLAVTGHWPSLLWYVVLGGLAGLAWYGLRRWLWRRAVGRGTWLEVVAPRETAVTASTAVWRLLSPLAGKAGRGWHLVHPPLAVEVHGDGRGHLSLAVWVPQWVNPSVVATEARRAWPGASVRAFTPPMADAGFKAAGFRLATNGTDHEMLVDDVYLRSRLAASVAPERDPLRPVFDALREQDGPTMLQILAKPAPQKWVSRLAQAARQPVKPRKSLPLLAIGLLWSLVAGTIRFVLDVFTGSAKTGHSQHSGGYQPPDPLQRQAMQRAAEKLKAGPHLLVAIRAVALRPGRGWAVNDASSVANGYRVAALRLRPKRLWFARSAVSDRFAHKGEWFLATCSELGVLFHLPADPALFGFTVAASSRPFPYQATRMRPEAASEGEPGWSRGKWTGSSGTTKTALAMRDHGSEDSDGSAEAEFFDPWGTPLSGDENPYSENSQFIDDDLDSDWDFPYDTK